MSEEKKEEVKLTPEQVEQNRKKAIDYYKKQIEVVKVQSEYEKILSEIETYRANRMEMIIRQAQMTAGSQEPELEHKENPNGETPNPQEVAPIEKKERTLKKVE